jgi:hypothetical protein
VGATSCSCANKLPIKPNVNNMARSTDFARFILLLCIPIMNSSAKVIILPHRKKFEKNIFAKKELIF